MIAQGRLNFRCIGIKANVRTKFLATVDAWVTAGSLDLAAGNRLKQTVGDLVPNILDTDGAFLEIFISNDTVSQFLIFMQQVDLP